VSQGLLYSPNWPWTHYEAPAALELTTFLPLLGLQTFKTMPGSTRLFDYFSLLIFFMHFRIKFSINAKPKLAGILRRMALNI
jgi:hypothetical protein